MFDGPAQELLVSMHCFVQQAAVKGGVGGDVGDSHPPTIWEGRYRSARQAMYKALHNS